MLCLLVVAKTTDILSNCSSALHHIPNRAAGLLLLSRGNVGRSLC
jgi:hypothetical protein